MRNKEKIKEEKIEEILLRIEKELKDIKYTIKEDLRHIKSALNGIQNNTRRIR